MLSLWNSRRRCDGRFTLPHHGEHRGRRGVRPVEQSGRSAHARVRRGRADASGDSRRRGSRSERGGSEAAAAGAPVGGLARAIGGAGGSATAGCRGCPIATRQRDLSGSLQICRELDEVLAAAALGSSGTGSSGTGSSGPGCDVPANDAACICTGSGSGVRGALCHARSSRPHPITPARARASSGSGSGSGCGAASTPPFAGEPRSCMSPRLHICRDSLLTMHCALSSCVS